MFYIINLRDGRIRKFVSIIFVFIITFFSLLILIRTFFYPVKYTDLINKYANEYNLDVYLILAVIKTESKFDTKAISHKGAKGLMQITDKTGEWAAKEIEIEEYDSEKLYDPEINIRIGCWYISRLLVQYENNIGTSLAAYNAGSGNVSKWLQNNEYSRDGKNLDQIPFKETRDYVKKVLKNMQIYKKLYKNL
ncbi:lytic transglycosylase domain-containing protein [Defluviitalea phaphyphila]|uniref:lytic transglycosylase domain-containing protein n=1 Tax=Defluviitalea phaphyphila TaxID=1473580 RepID=UPI00072FDF85|nr:lytic transglycosylase domain-containing protein [Defluviitalea phaphyphila]